MKKILIHVGVALGVAIVLCLLGIIISSIGKHKATLAVEESIHDTHLNTDTASTTLTEVSDSTSETTSTESESSSDTQKQEESQTQNENPHVDVDDLKIDDEDSTADDEYDSFAIANKIQKNNCVNVRQEPNSESEPLGAMYYGSVAQILDYAEKDDGLWLKVVSGNVEGYIKAKYFTYGTDAAKIIDEYTTKIAVINCNTLHVRTGPSTDFDFAGYLEKNETIPIIGYSGDWLQVQYASSEKAYIHSKYVNVIEDYVTAKSIEEIELQQAHANELTDRINQENVEENTGDENTNTEDNNSEDKGSEDKKDKDQTSEDKDNKDKNDKDKEQDGSHKNDKDKDDKDDTPPKKDTSGDSLDNLRQEVVDYALQYVGNAYVSGGQSLSTGTDCSGLTCYVYQHFGYYISRTPSGQLDGAGISVSRDELKPGDIICYETYTEGVCSHVGMYIGDGMIVHAANRRKGVVVSSLDIHTILGIKRIIY